MSVSRETSFELYRDLLVRWSGALNLSSSGDSDAQGFSRHIEDSLRLVPHLPVGLTRIIDLGSGQGFPAIPIAIRTGITVDLIESDRRKAAFLTTALATLALPGKVVQSRIEVAILPKAACVTARALAPMVRLLALARPFVAPGGCCLFLKARQPRRKSPT